jgi:hypothetical protein
MTRYRRTLIAIDVAGAFAKAMADESGQITMP